MLIQIFLAFCLLFSTDGRLKGPYVFLLPSGMNGPQQWILSNRGGNSRFLFCFHCPMKVDCSSTSVKLQARPVEFPYFWQRWLSKWSTVTIEDMHHAQIDPWSEYPQQLQECRESFSASEGKTLFVRASLPEAFQQQLERRNRRFEVRWRFGHGESWGQTLWVRGWRQSTGDYNIEQLQTPFEAVRGLSDMNVESSKPAPRRVERYGLDRIALPCLALSVASMLDGLKCLEEIPSVWDVRGVGNHAPYYLQPSCRSCLEKAVRFHSIVDQFSWMLEIAVTQASDVLCPILTQLRILYRSLRLLSTQEYDYLFSGLTGYKPNGRISSPDFLFTICRSIRVPMLTSPMVFFQGLQFPVGPNTSQSDGEVTRRHDEDVPYEKIRKALELLELKPKVTMMQVNSARKYLLLRYHPAEECHRKVQEINKAYEFLQIWSSNL